MARVENNYNGIHPSEQHGDGYHINLVGEWTIEVPAALRQKTEDVIAWNIPHEAGWYPLPGRTLILGDGDIDLKIKGAGLYNPSNVSYSGIKRATSPIPEADTPMPPLQKLFERDIVHADPTSVPPHALESMHSTPAPIGGMTIAAAIHDQAMFLHLTNVGLPANRPAAAYRYQELHTNGIPMGVSISQPPKDALPITAFQLYMLWNQSALTHDTLEFLKTYSGRGDQFCYENPLHRLEVLAKFAQVAGKLIFEFSAKAGLYRFSGGPDNWNIKRNPNEPLYFSDVDTSRQLETTPPTQHGWEALRNLHSAIHNWFYYFLPIVSYPESGYTADLFRQQPHDFVRAMLLGFFPDKPTSEIEHASSRIWKFFEPPLLAAEKQTCLGMRTGEYFLQQFYIRPVVHCVLLSFLSDLIQDSKFQETFPQSDTTPEGIQRYIEASVNHESHGRLFAHYSPSETNMLIAAALAKG